MDGNNGKAVVIELRSNSYEPREGHAEESISSNERDTGLTVIVPLRETTVNFAYGECCMMSLVQSQFGEPYWGNNFAP